MTYAGMCGSNFGRHQTIRFCPQSVAMATPVKKQPRQDNDVTEKKAKKEKQELIVLSDDELEIKKKPGEVCKTDAEDASMKGQCKKEGACKNEPTEVVHVNVASSCGHTYAAYVMCAAFAAYVICDRTNSEPE